MDAFIWNQRFVTGLETVDFQHRQLVDLVNRVGEMLVADHVSDTQLQEVFKQLADYARFHFAEEERLMADTAVDERHYSMHRQHHAQFLQQVLQMWQTRKSVASPAEILHGFLSSWLTVHILDEDQAMARQIASIRAGDVPERAYEFERHSVDNNIAALLGALHNLYHVLALQNRELVAANQSLGERVAERTRDLTAANDRLAAEQRETIALVKKMEEAQNHVLQSEKMAAIGQLAAGVAHEINNPIGFVNSNLGTLKNYVAQLLELIGAYEQCAADLNIRSERIDEARRSIDIDFLRQDIVALLDESRDGLERVKKIVLDLKDFSRVDTAEWQDADINAGIESTLNVVWNELKYKAEIVKRYGDLPRVRCMPGQLNQVFMNLLVNAAQALGSRGTITISTASNGDTVSIEIADTGCGMSPEVRKRIFEPFFTTKPVGKGTGLGLSLAYDIVVKKHGGSIDVDSTPGAGSLFRLVLPVAQASARTLAN